MVEEIVLGSIELSTPHSVSWVRVSAQEGWATVLRRVLAQLYGSPEQWMIKLYVSDGSHFKEALRFHAP